MSTGPEEKPTYEFGPFRLDPAERLLVRDGRVVALTPKAFDLLVYLVERHGRLVEKSALMSTLWPDTVVEEANVAYNISALRKALGDDREDARFIETVPTRGYRFVARVAVSSTRPSDSSAIPLPGVPGRSRGNLSAYRIGLGVAAAAMLAMVLLFFAPGDVTRTPAAVRENSVTRLTGNPDDRPLESARISPDGQRLAYADAAGVHVRRVDGGDAHLIADTRGMDVFGWTSDSENVRAGVCTEGRCTVWNVPITGSPRTPTGATWSDNERADISANGSELLTVTETGEIAVTRLNGSAPRRVVGAEHLGSARTAALSIDGSRVFFTSNGGTRIESVSAVGGATSLLHTLQKGWSVLSVGPVLPDGRLLFVAAQTTLPNRFASSAAQAIWQINTRESAGKSDAERVTEWRHELIEQVSASTDGKRIAFLSTEQQWDVYTASFDSMVARLDTPTQLTRDDRNDRATAWMPDNATVLFDSPRNGSSDLFAQRFDSDIATPVVTGPGDQRFPRVTSDGRWVLFGDDGGTDHRPGIARLPLTGGIPERVMPPINGIVTCAARGRCVIAERRGNELVVSSLDPLRGRGTELFRQHGDVPGASLSADGRKWAYIIRGEPGTPQRIRIVPFDNGSVSEIVVQNTEHLLSLDWLPTGGGFFSSEVTFGGSFSLSNGQLAQRSKLLFISMDGQTRTLWAPETLVVGMTIPSRDGRRVAINAASRRCNAWMVSVS